MLVQQNNPTPFVLLVILIIGAIAVSAIAVRNSEIINPLTRAQEAHSTQTLSVLEFEASQAAVRATNSAMAATQVYEQNLGQMTLVPMQRTLQAAQAQATIDTMQQVATQQVLQSKIDEQQQSARATLTAINQSHPTQNSVWEMALVVALILGTLITAVTVAIILIRYTDRQVDLTRRSDTPKPEPGRVNQADPGKNGKLPGMEHPKVITSMTKPGTQNVKDLPLADR
jgi:hypothetical protein